MMLLNVVVFRIKSDQCVIICTKITNTTYRWYLSITKYEKQWHCLFPSRDSFDTQCGVFQRSTTVASWFTPETQLGFRGAVVAFAPCSKVTAVSANVL